MRRSLSAVLAADVVGYSAKMSADAEGTLATLRRLRAETLGPAVAARHGRVVKSMGDGWIVIFGAVADAVECAMQLQDRLKIGGAMQLRMGLHLGDVTEAEEDIFGDGVNVAARLQDLAEPGALAISGAARALLDGTLRPSFDEAGERSLKNIAEPVPIWVRGGDVAGNKAALESSDLPRLAILPVATQDPREEVQELAMALTGDLLTHLNALRYLTARTVTTPEPGDYQLSANLRARGDRIRLETRLTAPDGAQVLSMKHDGDLGDSFDWQDETALSVGQAALDALMGHEMAGMAHLADQDCSAEQLMIRHLVCRTNDGAGIGYAADLMAMAIEKRPDWGASYANAVGFVAMAMSNASTKFVRHLIPMLPHWNAKVEELEPPFSSARIIFALGKIVQYGDNEGAIEDVRKVLRNIPFDPEVLTLAGWVYNYAGRGAEALKCYQQVENSVMPDFLISTEVNGRAMAHMLLGEHERSSELYRQAVESWPRYIGAHLVGAANSVMLGDKAQAARAVEAIFDHTPNLTMRALGWRHHASYPDGIVRCFEALREAGLPDG
ncbi:MAG: adenylate/guanylate cyclase domain-containing protein [Pseudomonadota bacterium]